MKKLLFLSLAILAMACAKENTGSSEAHEKNTTLPPPQEQGGVRIQTSLSQDKVLVGSDGLIYLKVDATSLEKPTSTTLTHKPTDFVIVLDRSGSMAEGDKMSFAKKSIQSLIAQLKPEDRMALVTFDSLVETPISLMAVNSQTKQDILDKLFQIDPRSNTNLGGGLERGISLLNALTKTTSSLRPSKIILLSDGLANEGITDLSALNTMAHRAADQNILISTIGMGLDFNEVLMSSLADHGQGNYTFLENLSSLEKVVSQEFYGASQVAARNLKIRLDLSRGFEIVDASGYPVDNQAGIITIDAGTLTQNQNKSFYITLRAPTQVPYSKPLGLVTVTYQVGESVYRVNPMPANTQVACLPIEKKSEVLGSINNSIYEDAWTKNNYGKVMKDSADRIREGDKAGALSIIQNYKQQLKTASEAAPASAPTMSKKISELDRMESDVNATFSGPDQEAKAKRASKSFQYQGTQSQRQ